MTKSEEANQKILTTIAVLQKRRKDGSLEDFCGFLKIMATARRNGAEREQVAKICIATIEAKSYLH
jgi:hypothetical protein